MVLYRKYIVCQLNRTSTRSPRRSMTSTLVMLWLVRGSGRDVALERSVRIRKTRSSRPPLFE
jgi:hypothetical protein